MDGVGLGASEMRNKGAVGVRFTYYDNGRASTEFTFVAAHLAAMEEALDRRNEDWMDIVRGLVFSSASSKSPRKSPSHSAGIYKPTSHLFIARRSQLSHISSQAKPR